jgi:hypothetical protein
MTSRLLRYGLLPAATAAGAWLALEALRQVSETLAIGVGVVFLLVAIPVWLWRRQ